MMDSTDLLTSALGLSSPWRVDDVRFDPEQGEIHFDVVCAEKRLPCPVCGEVNQPIHDRKSRTWQHLHFFQYKAFIHAALPRVACSCGKTTQVEVPWANSRSGFTLLFEALAITLAKQLPVRQVAHLLGVTDHRLWKSLDRIVNSAREEESHQSVHRIGVDEKHVGRLGYISIFHDADLRRTLFATSGRDQSVFTPFVKDLQAHGGTPEKIKAVSMDLSKSYQAGCRKHLPQANQCFDAFHLIKLANEALEEVRRAEVKEESDLKGIRWGTLKDASDWNEGQLEMMHWLQRSGLKTARAWRMKERLREVLREARAGIDPIQPLQQWVSWARRSRLSPFKRLGATIRDHMDGIINSYKHQMSNGTAELINSKIQAAIARARGFRTYDNLFTVIYLLTGKLTHLPRSPYQHTRGAVA